MTMSIYNIVENIAKEARKGSMVAFPIKIKVANFLQDRFENLEGDVVEPGDMHITIGLVRNPGGNGGKILSLLDKLCGSYKPIQCRIKSFGTFDPHESNDYRYVLWAKPEGEEIQMIHDDIFKLLKKNGIKIDNGSFEFDPHITIKYCKERPENLPSVNGSFSLDRVGFYLGGRRKEVKLG